MLRVSPKDRPDAAHLCQVVEELRPLPEEVGDLDQQVELDGGRDDPLLNTILLPKDLKLLDVNLPRANYDGRAKPRIHESLIGDTHTPKYKSSSLSSSRQPRRQVQLPLRRRPAAAQ
jgi:hypothetical protein